MRTQGEWEARERELLTANARLVEEVRTERMAARCAAEWSKAAMESSWDAALAEFEAEAKGQQTGFAPGDRLPGLHIIGHWHRQRMFSLATFGPGARTAGVIDHIRKELIEVENDVAKGIVRTTEWIDVIILACDGALRAGFTPEELAAAIADKQRRNEARQWPDWRTAPADKAIEHVRTEP